MPGNERKVHTMCKEVAELGKIKGTKHELSNHCGVHAISNVDKGVMVEVPCRVGSNGVEPLAIGDK